MNRIMKILFGATLVWSLFSDIGHTEGIRTVLFDQGHDERFLADRNETLDLSSLAALLEKKGFTVKTGKDKISPDVLTGVDALIISGPFRQFSEDEIDAIVGFIKDGGSLAVMLHIGIPLKGLLHRIGVNFSNGVIHESRDIIDNNDLNFKVTHLKPHELMKGIKQFNLYGGWAVINVDNNSEVIAETGPMAWIDMDGNKTISSGDAVQTFGVVVAGGLGKGRFVVFADDAIFQNKFLDEVNVLLGMNLVEWLGKGK